MEKDINPTDKFTGLASIYNQARPGYSAQALGAVVSHCGLKQGDLLVDVGCGTGISSRAFARLGLRVIGIEPNDDMRAVAETYQEETLAGALTYQKGKAEETGLPAKSAHAVAAAQAFHWFEPEATLLEFQRITKAGGWVILIWNERQESDPFTKLYGSLIRGLPKAAEVESKRNRSGVFLLRSPLFANSTHLTFPNEQMLNETGLIERAFSSSYAPRDAIGVEKLTNSLRAVFKEYKQQDRVLLQYVTNVYLAQNLS